MYINPVLVNICTYTLHLMKYIKNINSWINYNPPRALTIKGWRTFDKDFQEHAPIRYWYKHTLKRAIVYPIKWKYEAICDWFRYRTYDRYHVITTGLEPGYCGIDKQILYSNFNMLKDFVEISKASQEYRWTGIYEKEASWCEKHVPFYYVLYPFRRADLGIKTLVWETTLDDPTLPELEQSPTQAVYAREIMSLYTWWTTTRPARKEIEFSHYDDQGLGMLGSLDDDFNKDAEDYKKHVDSMQAYNNQEDLWEKEDDEMLIRLIKIRNVLWT